MGGGPNGGRRRGGQTGYRYTKDSSCTRDEGRIHSNTNPHQSPGNPPTSTQRIVHQSTLTHPVKAWRFDLGMRSWSGTLGRSSLSSASEAEFGGEGFGSLRKAARLSWRSGILWIRLKQLLSPSHVTQSLPEDCRETIRRF